jgi:hypothetical protein
LAPSRSFGQPAVRREDATKGGALALFALRPNPLPAVKEMYLDKFAEVFEHCGTVVLPVAEPVKGREAALIEHDGLAVDEA